MQRSHFASVLSGSSVVTFGGYDGSSEDDLTWAKLQQGVRQGLLHVDIDIDRRGFEALTGALRTHFVREPNPRDKPTGWEGLR